MTKLIDFISDNWTKKELAEMIVDLHKGSMTLEDINRLVSDSILEIEADEEDSIERSRAIEKTHMALQRF